MPSLIAHLSDLHYGEKFDLPLWNSVAATIREFRPQVLVASGDFVDDPREDHMRAAKAELDRLAIEAKATLYVVPGNHDLFAAGLATKGGRSGWFDHVFNQAPAPTAGSAPSAPNGFSRSDKSRGATIVDRARALLGLGGHRQAPPQRTPRPDGTSPPMLREPLGTKLLLALIDSNSTEDLVGLATGRVSIDDLTSLDNELRHKPDRHLARIAIVHHHLLPIAHSGGGLSREPFMVFQNAGDLLDVLARHRFDLVLHGHQHRAQFARIDFTPNSAEGYPIAVASAGSAALKTPKDPAGNAINLITVADNGRITVESLHYGGGVGPNREGVDGQDVRRYHEPIESVKRRAHVRARQRHPIAAARRELRFAITEQGDLIVEQQDNDLRRVRGTETNLERPQMIGIPTHGRLVLGPELDERSQTSGYALSNDSSVVCLPQPLGVRPAAYTVRYSIANSMNMTVWEAEERAAAKEREGVQRDPYWNHEAVSTYINYPVDEVLMRLALPPSLANAIPFLECGRRRGFPDFEPDAYGNLSFPTDDGFDLDTDIRDDAALALRRDGPDDAWTFTINRPLVGYRYRLRWKLPGSAPAEPVNTETRQWRETLLSMASRDQPSHADVRSETLFAELSNQFRQHAGARTPGEDCTLSLFVYDDSRLAMRPVLWHGPRGHGEAWRKFTIPLGDGIAGAAFLRRRTVPWVHDRNRSIYVKPVTFNEAVVMRTRLTIPIYHQSEQDRADPSPWSVIGVVSFASSDLATRIPALLNDKVSEDDTKLLRDLRVMSQASVHRIIRELRESGAD